MTKIAEIVVKKCVKRNTISTASKAQIVRPEKLSGSFSIKYHTTADLVVEILDGVGFFYLLCII